MLAVDTNLIVRYLTGDHPKQSAKARAIIDGEDVFVSTTVLLEAECVLRSVYSLGSMQICVALRAFAGLPRVSLEDPALVAAALDRMAHGLDFADALHLGRAEDCEAFVTFDQQFIKAARAGGYGSVRAPLPWQDEHAGALRSRNGRRRARAADQEDRVLRGGVRAMQIARTEYLVTDSLIPDATSKAWLGRRDILPPRLLSAPRPSPRRVNRERHPRKVRSSRKAYEEGSFQAVDA